MWGHAQREPRPEPAVRYKTIDNRYTMPVLKLQSLWSATAPAGPHCDPLTGAQRAQAAVIGAGYTGLSAALHLAEAGREVVVVEAADIGERASGLNGGQVIAGVKPDPDTLERLLGPYAGGRLVATTGTGPDLVFELITRHGIECEAKRSGWLQPATSVAALEQLARRVEQWLRRGAPVSLPSFSSPSARTPTPVRNLSDVLPCLKRGCNRPFITGIGPDCVARSA